MNPLDWYDKVKGAFDFINFPSPREFLMEYLLNLMLNPKTPKIVKADYLELVDFLKDLALAILPIYFVVAVVMGLWKSELSVRLTQWFQAVLVVIALVPVLPAMIVGSKTFVDLLARLVFIRMLGDNPEEALRSLFDLSGEKGLDLILSIIQILGMIGLCLGLLATAAALVASVLVLIIGFVLRFLGDAGEAMFHTSIKITLYGVTGNGIALITLGAVVLTGQLIVGDNDTSRGFVNTLAWLAAGYASWFMLKRTAGSIRTTAASVADGARKLKGGKSSDDSGYDPDGGKKQTDDEAATYRKHTRARKRGKSSDDPNSRENGDTEGVNRNRGKKSSSKTQDEEGTEPNRQDRAGRQSSSTKSRLLPRHNNGKRQSDSQSEESSREHESDSDSEKRDSRSHYRRSGTEREHSGESTEIHANDRAEDKPPTTRTPKEERRDDKEPDPRPTHERRRS